MKTIVMIPTYNEAENIEPVLWRILAQPFDLEVVVVDDNSSDGTAEAVRRVGAKDPRVHLLLRTAPRGRGLAGKDGFLWALRRGADYILEMDGDGSHDPAEIGRFMAAIRGGDMVIGSRFVSGGKAVGRGWLRDTLSSLARAYLRLVINVPVADPTSGYRLFRRKALEAIKPPSLTAPDPFIVTEVLYRSHQLGLRIKEIPIVFQDRVGGESKLSSAILIKYLFRAIKLRFSGGKS